MSAFPANTVLTVIAISVIYYIYTVFNEMLSELEERGQRIRRLSVMCQVAEYRSNKPYFTSLGNHIESLEYPDWLYKHIQEQCN